MKLIEIKGLGEAFDLFEMFASKFKTIRWTVEQTAQVGYGVLENGTEVKVQIDPKSYCGYQGGNLSFMTWNGTEYTEDFRDVGTTNASAIIGAVKNALKDKVNDFDLSFVLLIAKNNVATRFSIYSGLANRLAKELNLRKGYFDVGLAQVTVISWLDQKTTADLIDKLKASIK